MTAVNQRKESIVKREWEREVKKSKLPEARENASDQVAICLSFDLIGWESSTSFLNLSRNELKQKQRNKSRNTVGTKLKLSLLCQKNFCAL